MAWHQPGDEPLSEPMMVDLLTHVCVTRLNELNKIMVWYRPEGEKLSPFDLKSFPCARAQPK